MDTLYSYPFFVAYVSVRTRDPDILVTQHLASNLDVSINRQAVKYSRREQLARIAWSLGELLIRFSPRPAFAWRRFVLRLFGATVGAHVNIYPSTKIYMPWHVEIGSWSAIGEDVFIYSLSGVRIGSNATLSYRSHICTGTHDLNHVALPLVKLPVVIEDGAWIGTEAFIGPGVTIGSMAVVGARAVVVKSVSPNSVVAGNPARVVGQRTIQPSL